MAKILIVDDEPQALEAIRRSFLAEGHEAQVARCGREAIDLGVQLRPDVLVTDWILPDNVLGLHVAHTLRTIECGLQTILMTAFASADLRKEAEDAPIAAVLQKPFEVGDLTLALSSTLAAERSPTGLAPVGVWLTDSEDRLEFANWRARELFAGAHLGEPEHLGQVFGEEMEAALAAAHERWCVVSPRGDGFVGWSLRARCLQSGATLYVCLPADDEYLLHHPVVELLLDVLHEPLRRWPYAGHALVVGPSEVMRRTFTAELQRMACICHAAECAADGQAIFDRDSAIAFVLVEYDAHDANLADFVEHVSAGERDVVLVGCGDEQCHAALARIGVHRFVPCPYVIEDLLEFSRTGPCWAAFAEQDHPLVRKALRYVERNLARPDLSVGGVAQALGVNTTYLAHLFSLKTGVRMSRHIAQARVQMAKRLLLTTDWQIKRIAFETGHRNANWFTEVFRQYAGTTPSRYRREGSRI